MAFRLLANATRSGTFHSSGAGLFVHSAAFEKFQYREAYVGLVLLTIEAIKASLRRIVTSCVFSPGTR